jgi:putative FmdB family regulatory protein
MPTYEYRCSKCAQMFAVVMSMTAHDTAKVKCPACRSAAVVQQFSTFFAKTSRKS